MMKMRFHEPSPLDKLFRTPPAERPLLNLDVTHRPERLPKSLQKVNTGGSRWFDLVMGYGMDEAKQHDTDPRVVHAALDVGNLLVHAYFVPIDPNARLSVVVPHEHAKYVGAVEAYGTTLIVAGGKPTEPTKTSMQFTKVYGGGYQPYLAQTVRTARRHMLPIETMVIPNAFVNSPAKITARMPMPRELVAASILSAMADEVIECLQNHTMTVDVRLRL